MVINLCSLFVLVINLCSLFVLVINLCSLFVLVINLCSLFVLVINLCSLFVLVINLHSPFVLVINMCSLFVLVINMCSLFVLVINLCSLFVLVIKSQLTFWGRQFWIVWGSSCWSVPYQITSPADILSINQEPLVSNYCLHIFILHHYHYLHVDLLENNLETDQCLFKRSDIPGRLSAATLCGGR